MGRSDLCVTFVRHSMSGTMYAPHNGDKLDTELVGENYDKGSRKGCLNGSRKNSRKVTSVLKGCK